MTSFVKHFFIPYSGNNHRAKAIHIDVLFVYLLLLIVFQNGLKLGHKIFPDVLGYATDIHVEQLLSGTNQKRQEQGLSPLNLNSELSAAAAAKAVDMFAKNYWAHNNPEGKTPWDFIVSSGYRYTVAGENLAKNFGNSGGVVDAWMASPTHRDNLLKESYRDVGFAVVNGVLNGEETTLVVQMFGSSTAKPVVQAPPPVAAVEVPDLAAQAPVAPPETVASAYEQVTKKPIINIPTLSREVAYLLLGIVMTVLVLDAWVVSRRKIVRFAGHNLAHFVFFAMVIIALSFIERGALI